MLALTAVAMWELQYHLSSLRKAACRQTIVSGCLRLHQQVAPDRGRRGSLQSKPLALTMDLRVW
jgi:hypothetical protein